VFTVTAGTNYTVTVGTDTGGNGGQGLCVVEF